MLRICLRTRVGYVETLLGICKGTCQNYVKTYVQNMMQSLLVGLFWHAIGHQQAAQICVKCSTIVACWTPLACSRSPRSCSDMCKMQYIVASWALLAFSRSLTISSDMCKIQYNRCLLDSFAMLSVTNKLLRHV